MGEGASPPLLCTRACGRLSLELLPVLEGGFRFKGWDSFFLCLYVPPATPARHPSSTSCGTCSVRGTSPRSLRQSPSRGRAAQVWWEGSSSLNVHPSLVGGGGLPSPDPTPPLVLVLALSCWKCGASDSPSQGRPPPASQDQALKPVRHSSTPLDGEAHFSRTAAARNPEGGPWRPADWPAAAVQTCE